MIRLELTEAELQALCGLLDAGVKATGLRAVKDAAVLLEKLEAATAAQRASPALGGCKVPTPETVANANIPSSGDYSDNTVHPGVMCGNGFATTPSSPPDERKRTPEFLP
jgi:hypothetical protein